MEMLKPDSFSPGIHNTQHNRYPAPAQHVGFYQFSSHSPLPHILFSTGRQNGLGIWYFILPYLGRLKHRKERWPCKDLQWLGVTAGQGPQFFWLQGLFAVSHQITAQLVICQEKEQTHGL